MNKVFNDIFWNQIENMDVINSIKKNNNETFDLILSDPPYNINYTNNRRVKTRDNIHGVDGIMNDKDNLEMIENVYEEYFRILKEWKHCYIFTRWDVAEDHTRLLRKAWFIVKNNLIWDKWNMSMWDLLWDYGSQYENILFCIKPFSKGKRKWKANKLNKIGKRSRHPNILKYNRIVWKKQVHSHQKPISLLQFLIQKSTKIGEKIYDWFIWSNSLGISAASLWRKYSGVELNTEVFEILKENTNKILNSFKKKLDTVEDYTYIDDLYVLIINKKKIEMIKWENSDDIFNVTKKIVLKNSELLEYIDKSNILEYKGSELYIINI